MNTAESGVLQCPCIFYISVTSSEAHAQFISRITLWIWICKAYNMHESRKLYSSSATDKNHTYWHMGNVMTIRPLLIIHTLTTACSTCTVFSVVCNGNTFLFSWLIFKGMQNFCHILFWIKSVIKNVGLVFKTHHSTNYLVM